uniref:Uncharacterized protein n=1 Tax=Arundo donax TaxID=35708 RepID=A0A0A9ACB8_ARUDO
MPHPGLPKYSIGINMLHRSMSELSAKQIVPYEITELNKMTCHYFNQEIYSALQSNSLFERGEGVATIIIANTKPFKLEG